MCDVSRIFCYVLCSPRIGFTGLAFSQEPVPLCCNKCLLGVRDESLAIQQLGTLIADPSRVPRPGTDRRNTPRRLLTVYRSRSPRTLMLSGWGGNYTALT